MVYAYPMIYTLQQMATILHQDVEHWIPEAYNSPTSLAVIKALHALDTEQNTAKK